MIQTSKRLNFIIDTNIFLSSVSRKSKNNCVLQKIINQEIDLFISNDILLEYKEKLEEIFSQKLAKDIIEIFLIAKNVYKINPHFNWNLISVDPDDNKFVDCAITGNVDYIVTNDKHFDVLKNIDFPKVNAINVDEFKKIFN